MIDLQEFESKLGYPNNFDVVKKLAGDNKKVYIYYLSSLADNLLIDEFLKGINAYNDGNFLDQFVNGSIQKSTDISVTLRGVLSGMLAVIGEDKIAYLLEVRAYPNRSIQEPSTEKSVRGSRDGFTESIIQNVGLLRRRIRDGDLQIELLHAGKTSQTDIALCYMKSRVRDEVVNNLHTRINDLKIDNLVMSDRALEENVFQQNKHFYPLVRYTERPDIAATHVLKGSVAVIVDTSASVILTPTTLLEHMKHVEEYRQTPLIGTLMRSIRYLAIAMSILLLPIWYLIVSRTDLQSAIFVRPVLELAIPIFWQIIIVEIMIEVLRIATIHTPSQLADAIGIVAAILLGQMAIDLGVFVPEILLYCSLSAIGGFATPSYELSLANKVSKIILLVLVYIGGKVGFIFGFFGLIYYLLTIKIFGVPYLYPMIPFDASNLISYIFRKPQKKERKS